MRICLDLLAPHHIPSIFPWWFVTKWYSIVKGKKLMVMFESCLKLTEESYISPSLCTVEVKTRKCCLSNFETRFNRFSGWLLSGRETTLISGFLVNYTKLSNSRSEAIWNGYSTTFYICSWQSPFVHIHAVLLTVTELATSLLMKYLYLALMLKILNSGFHILFLKKTSNFV